VLQRILDIGKDNYKNGKPDFNVNFYAVNKRGEYAGASIWNGSLGSGTTLHPARFAVADARGARLDEAAYLLKRGERSGAFVRSPRQVLQDWFLRQITKKRRRYRRFVYNDPERLKATIRPGDVLLVDGNQRVSQAVKYLTQSSWSHSALFIGDALLRKRPAQRAELLRRYGRAARYLMVEALVDKGVIVSPVVKYIDLNLRICRPVGLRPEDLEQVLDYVIDRIGFTYDRRNFLDLMRYLLPFRFVPPNLREEALHFGSGKDTETICSTVIAEAFG